MPFNGSGTFSPLTPPYPFVTGTTISAPDVNSVLADMATNGLSNAVTRDGQSPLTANWAVGGYNITGIGTLGCTTFNLSGAFTAGSGITITTGGLAVTAGGVTVAAGGAAITGNSSVTGTFAASSSVTGSSIISGSTTLPVTFPWEVTAAWEQNATVVNGDFTFAAYMPFTGAITALKYKTASGTFTVAVKVGGSTVTGLSAVAVSSSSYNTALATAANTFVAGDVLTGTISSAASSPTGSVLTLYGTRTL